MVPIFLFLSVVSCALFKFGVSRTEELSNSSDESVYLDTCYLYGNGMSVGFSRTRRFASHPAPWRLFTVTCGTQSHAFAYSSEDPGVRAGEDRQLSFPPQSCEDLLHSSSEAASLAFRLAVGRCLGPVTRLNREAMSAVEFMYRGTVREGVVDALLMSKVKDFSSVFARPVITKDDRSSCSLNNAKGDSVVIDIENKSIKQLTCKKSGFRLRKELPILLLADKQCTEIAETIDIDQLCATAEDLMQSVTSTRRRDLETCELRVEGSPTNVILTKYGINNWKVEGFMCGSDNAIGAVNFFQVFLGRYQLQADKVDDMQKAEKIMRTENLHAEKFSFLDDMKDEIFNRYQSLSGRCSALKMGNLSGISFNKICRRS